jgi:hypothetical protein
MNEKLLWLALSALLLASGLPVEAQQTKNVRRIGYFHPNPPLLIHLVSTDSDKLSATWDTRTKKTLSFSRLEIRS